MDPYFTTKAIELLQFNARERRRRLREFNEQQRANIRAEVERLRCEASDTPLARREAVTARTNKSASSPMKTSS